RIAAMRDAANNETGAAGVLMGLNAGTQANSSLNQGVQEQTSNEPPMNKLKKLKELFEMELITESEYTDKKKAILDSM
ncbi:MAG: SHOCT domain-containing protein, partial [Maribacter sp.]